MSIPKVAKLCDEQHPVCKNCQKSKRECLGYDPIFKQQQQHPSNIQPALNSSHPAPATSVPSNGPPLPSPSASTAPSSTATYGSLPSVLPSSYNSGASSTSNTPANAYESSHSAPPPTVKNEPFEYGGPAIDPALDSVGAPPSTSTPHLPPVKSVAPIISPIAQRPSSSTLNLRGGGSYPHPYSAPQPAAPSPHWTSAYYNYPAKKMRVDDLINWSHPPPPKPKVFPDQPKLDEIRGLYEEIYASGLEGFFETKWYTEEWTGNRLMLQDSTLEMLAGFLSVVGKAEQNNQAAMNEPANVEFRVVWDLACLALTSEAKINPPSVIPPDNDPAEARNRVVVIDALLSGEILGNNPLVRPPPTGDYHRVRELDFWYHLGEFCRVEPVGDPPNPDILSQRDQILSRIRMLLDGRENRDVLYSIAIMRALSPDYPSDFESTLPQHLDENDPKSKLSVARKFVQDEAKVTGGTTNIVRRFSELAVIAFISPGANVARRRWNTTDTSPH
ncbi:hypothetical protein TruAng_009829 [Truncatella angustata]|nr:hypothetical protein TruAng_009829 [Truncatella angustata]